MERENVLPIACSSHRLVGCGVFSLVAGVMLAGCGGPLGTTIITTTPIPPVTGTYAGVSFNGKALVGTEPLVGASVQLYAAGTAGNGVQAGNLLAAALTTDAAGAFVVPASYSCPLATSQIYAVATGGAVGAGSANSAIELLTAIGACNGVGVGQPVVLNEATTAAGAWALAQFATPGAGVGASSTNATGLANSFLLAAALVYPATGVAPGVNFPANSTFPAAKIGSMANLLHTCTKSSASSSACSQLFSLAASGSVATPSNTFAAVLDIVQHPGTNVAALYALSMTDATFPTPLAAAPADWTLYTTLSGGGMNGPTTVGVLSTGNVWVANYYGVASQFTTLGAAQFASGVTGYGLTSSYGLAVDAANNAWIPNDVFGGSITELSASGVGLSGAGGYAAGALEFPVYAAIDPDGSVWVVDYGSSHISRLSSSGAALSGASGYSNAQITFPVAIAIDASHNGWVANQTGTTVTRLSQDGLTAVSANCCNTPTALAIDQRGYVWIANFYSNSVSEVSSAAATVSAGYTGGGMYRPQGVAIDGAGNVWVESFQATGIAELAGSQSLNPGAMLSPANGWAADAPLHEAYSIAIDASGNVWVANFGSNTVTRYIGLAAPTKSPAIGPAQAP